MLCGGDEYGRTQMGNNNAYCQDNEISWLNWDRNEHQQRLFEFVSRLIAFRKKHPVFSRPNFFRGRQIRGSKIKDIMWLNGGGIEMSNEEWEAEGIKCLGVMLSGNMGDITDFYGNPIRDDTFLLCFNAHHEAVEFTLPQTKAMSWKLLLDTSAETGFVDIDKGPKGDRVMVEPRSTLLFILQKPEGASGDEMSDYVKEHAKYSID
jgi:isoamylase